MHDGAPSAHAEIEYTHALAPAFGSEVTLAPGLMWVRLPLPFRLNHVNIWLLEEPDGWTAIDTGAATVEARNIWDALAAGPMRGKPIRRLIATHGHTDHVGLASWIVDRFDCPFISTQVEWMTPQLRRQESFEESRPEVIRFFTAHGCDEEQIALYHQERRRTHAQLLPMPQAYERIRNGDEITFGGRSWRVITAGGHAAEHASFYCAADNILIVGDQILSKITPVIGVFAQEPNGNPLAEYLTSFPPFEALPPDVLVLPSHGLPYRGLHRRIHELVDHHHARLAHLEQLMDRPKNATELTAGLFARAVAEGQARLALAETLAHIHFLLVTGRIERVRADNGQWIFRR